MNDYKELIKKSLEALSYAEQINTNEFYLTRADLKIIVDAIEQLVKERDAAIAKSNKAIVPPCGIGDTVYVIYDKKIYAAKMVLLRVFVFKEQITFSGNAVFERPDLFYKDGRMEEISTSFRLSPLGTDHDGFLTREEAEEALRNMRGVTDE